MTTTNAIATKHTKLKPSPLLIGLLSGLLCAIIMLETLTLLEVSIPASLHQVWQGALCVILLTAGADAWMLNKLKTPKITRSLSNYLALNQWGKVSLILTNNDTLPLKLTVYDHAPHYVDFQQLPQSVVLTRYSVCIQYPIRPKQRGHFYWQVCELMLTSQWRLWHQRRYLPLASDSRVYPDFTKLYDAHLSTIEQWVHYLGVRPQQRRGLGQDFQQLREFRQGDTLRQIDWKATSKQRFPITKEYQDERDQQIIFVLDCGQRMRTQEHNRSHFDHALNACLLLAYVALKQEDAVGLTTFAAQKNIDLKPKKGLKQLNTLLNAVYQLNCTQQAADYSRTITQLLANVKRRSLIIFITNLRSLENEETFKSFKLLGRRHKVLIASLREEIMDQLRTEPIHDLETALTYCGNIEHSLARKALHEKLLAHNLPVIEALPKQFAPQLVNHYLALKRSGAL